MAYIYKVLGLGLFVFIGVGARAQSDEGDLRVQVLDRSHIALAGAILELSGAGVHSSSQTDEQGWGTVTQVPAGVYRLRVSKLGYGLAERQITVSRAKEARVTVVLEVTTEQLDDVTVIGKTATQQAREQPVRAVVVNTRAASEQPATLAELMNRAPGIRIRQSGGLGNAVDVSINGFQGRAIKYFRDGIPLDYLGDGYNITSVPLDLLERVEVYKGVLPVSLGADALGGAVNLVTKQQLGSTFHASYEFASFNTHRLALNGTYASKDQRWFAGADVFYNHADNDYSANVSVPDPETRNPEIVKLPMFHNGFTSYYGEFFGGLSHRKWADELRVGVAMFALRRDEQHPALMTDPYGAIVSKQRTIAPSVHYRKVFLDNRLSIDQFLAYNTLNNQRIDTLHGQYDWYGNFSPRATVGESRLPSQSDVDQRQVTARTNIGFRIAEGFKLDLNYVLTDVKRTGSDPLGARLEGTDTDVLSLPARYRKQVLGLSASNDWLGGKLQNELVGKYFHFQGEGMNNTWLAAAVTETNQASVSGTYGGVAEAIKYRIHPSGLLRASMEWAYRLPERDELFGNNVFIVPNFELEPERSFNVNLGYRFEKERFFSAELAGFYRRTKDLILLVPVQAPNAQYQNQENVKGFGVEADLAYYFWGHYWVNANATWQDLRLFGITSSQDAWMNDARLRNTPYFFANAGLGSEHAGVMAPHDLLKVFFNYNFLREFYLETIPKDVEAGGFLGLAGSAAINSNLIIPNQHLLSAGFTYRMAFQPITLGAEVKNLLDKDLFDYYRVQRAGRSFHVKMSYQL